jgi:hypothetical protein
MIMLRTLKVAVLGAALLLGTAALAEDQTSGPAAGTNVAPSKGEESHGAAGEPGMPGGKSGPAVKPGENATTEKMKTQTARKGTAGAPGTPGMPGSKSGEAVTPPNKR